MLEETQRTLDELKKKLRGQKDPNSGIPNDLYSHLNEVFNRIIKFHPYDAFDKFEEISHLVKQTTFNIEDPKYDFEINGNALEGQPRTLTNKKAIEHIERVKKLLQEKTIVSKQDKELLTKKQVFDLPNFVH